MFRLTMVGLVVAFSVVSGVQPALASKSAAEVRIEKALDEPTTVEFFDAPLQDLVDWWKDLHKIEIQLDATALEVVGLGPGSSVTADLSGISLETGLNLVLKELELTWMICNDVLLITTPERVASVLTIRIYQVEDLQPAGSPMAKPSSWGDSVGTSKTGGDQLSRVLTRMIAPESWTDSGGPGAIEATSPNGVDVLVVRQTLDVHRQIANLLSRLRAAAEPEHGPAGPTTAFESALESPTTIEFFDTPLQHLVDWWKDLHGIEIQLDTRALHDVGLGSDTPVTVDLKGVRLESALNLVLGQLDLTWTIHNEVLLITTREEAELNLSTRIHGLAALRQAQNPDGDIDAWAGMILKMIDPESWADLGGPGSIETVSVNGVPLLVVRQTYENHRKIEKLFAELRVIAQGDQR